MTYREIQRKLAEIPDEKLDNDASVLLLKSDEVVPVVDFVTDWGTISDSLQRDSDYYAQGINQVDGILDEGHPYLTIDF